MVHHGVPAARFREALRTTIADAHDVLDIGTSQRFAKELAPYRAWFAGKRYVAAGYKPDPSYGADACDEHQDIHAITHPDASFDAVLCIEVIEHVQTPPQAVDELWRVLRPGGRLLLTTPFLTSYHGKAAGLDDPSHAGYPDFWRFTHQGLALLCSRFRDVEVQPVDGPIECRLKLMRFDRLVERPPLRGLLDRVDRPTPGRATTRHLVLATK